VNFGGREFCAEEEEGMLNGGKRRGTPWGGIEGRALAWLVAYKTLGSQVKCHASLIYKINN
jgi:hypothetical protein